MTFLISLVTKNTANNVQPEPSVSLYIQTLHCYNYP